MCQSDSNGKDKDKQNCRRARSHAHISGLWLDSEHGMGERVGSIHASLANESLFPSLVPYQHFAAKLACIVLEFSKRVDIVFLGSLARSCLLIFTLPAHKLHTDLIFNVQLI